VAGAAGRRDIRSWWYPRLVDVADVDVVDGRYDRGEGSAGPFGRLPLSIPRFRLLRGGGEPPAGLETATLAPDRLDRPVDGGGQQADEQKDQDSDQHSHGHHPFRRSAHGIAPVKPVPAGLSKPYLCALCA
jgi:hypothetical protein